jgi:phenylacetate-CoA ligase
MAHYDPLETQDVAVREAQLSEALPIQIAHAQQHSPAFARILQGIDANTITSRAALARLPVVRKSELMELQKQGRPFGGFAALAISDLARIFQSSPGPVYQPEGRRSDYWRFARALFAAGFREGDLIHNAFSYHFTPAGFMVEAGALALGCAVFPAGSEQPELQVEAIADLKPQGYTGTPAFLRTILDKAAEMEADISSLTKALVSRAILSPSLRHEFKERGIEVMQCYATDDLGLIAFETSALEGLVVDEGLLVEIVHPGTGEPLAEGKVGELVVTTFNPEYPLIRFATGDLSAILPGPSPCGCTNTRIKGWLGRVDQAVKVKGMFVHTSQVAMVLKRHPEILKGRLVVDRGDHNDVMTLHCEVADPSATLAQAITASIRELCELRGEVVFTAPGTLPNDGKMIDDIRQYG